MGVRTVMKYLWLLMVVVTILVPCLRASVRICPDHDLYIYAWISKQFGTVVALEEEMFHLNNF